MDVRDAVGVALHGYWSGEAVDRLRAVELRQVGAHLFANVVALQKEANDGSYEEQKKDCGGDPEPAALAGSLGGRFRARREDGVFVAAMGCRTLIGGAVRGIFGAHGLGQV